MKLSSAPNTLLINNSPDNVISKNYTTWLNLLSKINTIERDSHLDFLLSNACFVTIQNNILVFSVQNDFTRERLIRNYFLIIKKIISMVDNSIKMISVIIKDDVEKKYLNGVNELKNVNIKCSQIKMENTIFSKINTKFNFYNYITGESNFIAYKITKDIALNNVNYSHNNIFYIHSNVGMGKTHLLHAIVNEINYNNKKIKNTSNNREYIAGYLSAEKFMYNFINAVKNNTLFALRNEINTMDVFLIDDLQFICGKESTQKEFALVLNLLLEADKKIVIASSIPCHMLELHDERTKSILRSSNTIYIESCEYKLRLKILQNYNKNNEIIFEDAILKIIADKIKTNVRELEAGLNNLNIYLSISGKKATVDNICRYVQNYIVNNIKKITISSIINAVTKYYKISISDTISSKRTYKLVVGRQIIAYLAKEITTNSLKIIGEKLGNRDHSTILYYLKKLDINIKKNEQLIHDIDSIRKSIV